MSLFVVTRVFLLMRDRLVLFLNLIFFNLTFSGDTFLVVVFDFS